MKKQMRRVVPLALAGVMCVTSMTGCGHHSTAKLPYSLVKSTYEVYQESVAASEYANTRKSGVQQYEYHEVVNAEDKQKLISMVDRIEKVFDGAPNAMTDLLVDDATYENMKYMLDKYTLTRKEVVDVQNASNLYVVDVNYSATRAVQMTIPEAAGMIGLEGFYEQKYSNDNSWEANDKFGAMVALCMNDYCVKNAVMYKFSYNMGDHIIMMEAGAPSSITVIYGSGTPTGASAMQELEDSGFDPTQFVSGDGKKAFDYTDCDLNNNSYNDLDELKDYCNAWDIEAGDEKGAYAAYFYPDKDGDSNVTEEEMQEAMDELAEKGYPEGYTKIYVKKRDTSAEQSHAGIDVDYDEYLEWVEALETSGIARRVGLDMPVQSDLIPENQRIKFPTLAVNSIVGSLAEGYASANTDMFEDSVTYKLGGRGFFANAGSMGLNLYDTAFVNSGAEISIRYYIKETAAGLELVAALPTDMVTTSDVKKWRDEKPLLLTDEITSQIQQVLFGLDRVICNEDLAGVSGGTLVLNNAYAGLMCYGRIGTVISDYSTTLDAVIGYDEATQTYLCRCNRQYNIGGMNTGCTGKYKELAYVVVQMTSDGIRIVDELPVNTEMVSEPYIEPTPLADMVADSLPKYTTTVPQEIQDAINAVLTDYYIGCNARKLHIESEADVEKFGTTIGLEDVYSVSERLFTQNDADLAISRMKNYLTINGGSTVVPSNTSYQGCTPVLADVVLTETYNFNSAAQPVIEKVHYTFVQDNGRWRICGMEVLETNQVTFENSSTQHVDTNTNAEGAGN